MMQTRSPEGQPIEEYTAISPGGDKFVLRHEEDDTWSLWCHRGDGRYALHDAQGRPRTFSQPDSAAGLFPTWDNYGDFANEPELTKQWRAFMESSKVTSWPADLDWQKGPTDVA